MAPTTETIRAKLPVETATGAPPLESGDLLTAREFLRRYDTMPHVKKAELIEGIVYMGSPVRLKQHAKPEFLIHTWLGTYVARTPGVEGGANATSRLDVENVPQPDALLRILSECGGRSHLDEEGYLCGPSELVVEVCASSAAIDLHAKFRVYRRAGIQEYLVWRTVENRFDWFRLEEDDYRSNPADPEGIVRSRLFPGLWLDLAALLAMDSARVLDTLQRGLSAPEHAAFVTRLAVTPQRP